MNGHMTEAQTRSATVEDVDEKTFVRFCQFAYTGDYGVPSFETVENAIITSEVVVASNGQACPSPDIVDQDYPAEPQIEELPDDQWSNFGGLKSRKKLKRVIKVETPPKIRLRQSFEDSKFPPPESQQQAFHECNPRPNTSPEEDYTNVFLGHASLYVFAEKYGVEPLKVLALNKLHATLSTFTLYRARISDIVNLISYAYSTENTPDHEDRVDELRALVTHYAACEVDTIAESELFLSLLEEGGPFVRDFWRKVKERIT